MARKNSEFGRITARQKSKQSYIARYALLTWELD
jgi:hypothetical protein